MPRLLLLGGALALVVTTLMLFCSDCRQSLGTFRAGIDAKKISQKIPQSCSDVGQLQLTPTGPGNIQMVDAAERLGPIFQTKTFSLAVADLDGDDRDDILIGGHNTNPHLFVNTGTGFNNQSNALFAQDNWHDRHGYTLADLDNDGDLDIAIAGGGEDGVGNGSPNMFFKNETVNGQLKFHREEVPADMELGPGRSRAFIPLASSDGQSVDLYYTTLLRENFPNALWRNQQTAQAFSFAQDNQSFLTRPLNDHGRGVIADFDGDGHNDYLLVESAKGSLYWHPDSAKGSSTLAWGAFSAVAADFNNDKLLDIFIGRLSTPTNSDRISHNDEGLIYVMHKNGDNDVSSISFKTRSKQLEFNLEQHIPQTRKERLLGVNDIFLGARKLQPKSRHFVLKKHRAMGKPDSLDKPGIYIWFSDASDAWHIEWYFHDALDVFKGIVNAQGISDIRKENFFQEEPKAVLDAILINLGNGEFSRMCLAALSHQAVTTGATVADFNNDGWLDIIGVRHGEQGSENRSLFVLTNNAGNSFTLGEIAVRGIDQLHRADLIANGFFNADTKPDIVVTNGFGQIPGTNGSPRLMLNDTSGNYEAILIKLEGANANKFGIGAKVTLTDATDKVIGFRVQGLNTNISQDTHWLHFGLGNFQPPYQLTVEWPDATTTMQSFSQAGKFHVKQ